MNNNYPKEYDNLDTPYNNYLLREHDPEIATSTLNNNSKPGDPRPVKN